MYSNFSYLVKANYMLICKALLKQGYSGFRLEILEYVQTNQENSKKFLLEREQYYFDTLKPEYNILKIAGSSLGHVQSDKTKALLSLSAKGRIFSPETRAKMSTSSVFKHIVQISKKGAEPIIFPSMVEAGIYLSISRSQVSKYIKASKLYKDYTITRILETGNLSKKLDRKPFKQPILLTDMKTGESREFSSMAEGARYINRTPIQLRNALKRDAQDIKINGYKLSRLTKDANSKFEPNSVSIEVKNLDTKEVTVYSSITSAAKAMGSNQSGLSAYLIRNSSVPFKRNYLIRRLSQVCIKTQGRSYFIGHKRLG